MLSLSECVVKSTVVANTRSWSIIVEKLQRNSCGVIKDAYPQYSLL